VLSRLKSSLRNRDRLRLERIRDRVAHVLNGDQHGERQQEHHAREVDDGFLLRRDALAAHGFDQHEHQPAAVERGQRQQVRERQGDTDRGRHVQDREPHLALDALFERIPADLRDTRRPDRAGQPGIDLAGQQQPRQRDHAIEDVARRLQRPGRRFRERVGHDLVRQRVLADGDAHRTFTLRRLWTGVHVDHALCAVRIAHGQLDRLAEMSVRVIRQRLRLVDRDPIYGEDGHAGHETGLLGGRAGRHIADDDLDPIHNRLPQQVSHREDDQRGKQVHSRPGQQHSRAPALGCRGEAVELRRVFFAQHAHETADRQPVQRVVGARVEIGQLAAQAETVCIGNLQRRRHRAFLLGVDDLDRAEHQATLDFVAAHFDDRALFQAARKSEVARRVYPLRADAQPAHSAPQLARARREAQPELLHANAGALGENEMPKLVQHDQWPEHDQKRYHLRRQVAHVPSLRMPRYREDYTLRTLE